MLLGVTVRSITRSNGWLVGLGALVSNTERFMTPEEVADVLRVSISQVYTLMRSGQLHA
ncbi:MAG: helix-turn-helix domain-containing protein, partial [Actinobacteria bacterium]|nr:helix-turn-helix domain-containing protein [Actinomycetota bacterium]